MGLSISPQTDQPLPTRPERAWTHTRHPSLGHASPDHHLLTPRGFTGEDETKTCISPETHRRITVPIFKPRLLNSRIVSSRLSRDLIQSRWNHHWRLFRPQPSLTTLPPRLHRRWASSSIEISSVENGTNNRSQENRTSGTKILIESNPAAQTGTIN